jgi:asparagine synthase (glutamine-hydrolysing)
MARKIGTLHREYYFDPARQWEMFQSLQTAYGEPIMLLPLLHTLELSRAIYSDGIKVVLTGHGADELFYGYTGHVQTARLSRWIKHLEWISPVLRKLPTSKMPRPLLALSSRQGERKAALYRQYGEKIWPGIIAPEMISELDNVVSQEMEMWGELVPTSDYIDESNFVGLMVENTHSVTIAADLPAMMASVEMRAPFLDQQIISAALAVPYEDKISRNGDLSRLKLILKKAVSDLVPEELLYAPKRGFGFGIPLDNLLLGAWLQQGDALFDSPHTAQGLFRADRLKKAWCHFKTHGSQGSNVVPNMFAIQYWLQSNFS